MDTITKARGVVSRFNKEPEWPDFRKFCLETLTHTRDAGKNGLPKDYISWGSLRGFMVEHPVWGLDAQKARWPKLVPLIATPGADNDAQALAQAELITQHSELLKRHFGSTGHSVAALRKFIDFWKPGSGVLAIEDQAWKRDPLFVAWWQAVCEEGEDTA